MGNTKKTKLSLRQQVYHYAKSHVGHRVGRGECYDLADFALRHAGAKSAPDYGRITANADYRWGKSVDLLKARPGDILQFRNHRIKIVTVKKTKKTYPDGSSEESTETVVKEYSRPHHTAIVSSNNGKKTLAILEQNMPLPGKTHPSKRVQNNTIYVADGSTKSTTVRMKGKTKVEVETKTTIKVTGRIWVYRPEPK